MKMHLVSTLHDPENRFLEDGLSLGLAANILKEHASWGIAVTPETYKKQPELLTKYKQLGVEVVMGKDKVRDNHVLALGLGLDRAGKADIIRYGDADRELVDASANRIDSYRNYIRGIRLASTEMSNGGISVVSVIRRLDVESSPRRRTEIVIDALASEFVGSDLIDPAGSNLVFRVEAARQIVNSKSKEGLDFPATEWVVGAKELGFGVAGFYPYAERGGFEDPGELSMADDNLNKEREFIREIVMKSGWADHSLKDLSYFYRILRGKFTLYPDRNGFLAKKHDRVDYDIREWQKRISFAEKVVGFFRGRVTGELTDLANEYLKELKDVVDGGVEGDEFFERVEGIVRMWNNVEVGEKFLVMSDIREQPGIKMEDRRTRGEYGEVYIPGKNLVLNRWGRLVEERLIGEERVPLDRDFRVH